MVKISVTAIMLRQTTVICVLCLFLQTIEGRSIYRQNSGRFTPQRTRQHAFRQLPLNQYRLNPQYRTHNALLRNPVSLRSLPNAQPLARNQLRNSLQKPYNSRRPTAIQNLNSRPNLQRLRKIASEDDANILQSRNALSPRRQYVLNLNLGSSNSRKRTVAINAKNIRNLHVSHNINGAKVSLNKQAGKTRIVISKSDQTYGPKLSNTKSLINGHHNLLEASKSDVAKKAEVTDYNTKYDSLTFPETAWFMGPVDASMSPHTRLFDHSSSAEIRDSPLKTNSTISSEDKQDASKIVTTGNHLTAANTFDKSPSDVIISNSKTEILLSRPTTQPQLESQSVNQHTKTDKASTRTDFTSSPTGEVTTEEPDLPDGTELPGVTELPDQPDITFSSIFPFAD